MKIIDDGWWGVDKACHGWLHFGIVIGACWMLKFPLIIALAFSLLWGIVYEVFDGLRDVGFSWKDMIWNCIGMAMGAAVMLLGGWR